MESSDCLSTKELAARWQLSQRTLTLWRFQGFGPPYFRLSNKVRYRLQDIEAYESQNLHAPHQAQDKKRGAL